MYTLSLALVQKLGPVSQIARGLEDLGDDEVRTLLGQTLRAYSEEVKHGVR